MITKMSPAVALGVNLCSGAYNFVFNNFYNNLTYILKVISRFVERS